MAEDISSTSSNTIPFPTLTIVYLVNQAEQLIDEISQKYNNITVEDCNGFFNDGVKSISQEKKESVRNLYDSGISEEMIAEQVDLNLATVKNLIKIITTNSK